VNSSFYDTDSATVLRADEDVGHSPGIHELRSMLLNLMQGQQQILESVESNTLAVNQMRTDQAGKNKPVLTVAEVAKLTCRCQDTVRRWIGQGKLKADRVQGTGPRGRYTIRSESLQELLGQGLGEDLPPTAL
jgi:excisionase family DNA binding protein